VDLGGTKIEAVILGPDGSIWARERSATPRGSYRPIVEAVGAVVRAITARFPAETAGLPVGVGIPGTISPATGLVKNANSTELIGHALDRDLERALGREVRLANDANCFALSEALGGAATTHGLSPADSTVFGVILGTGVGGGLVVRGKLWEGRDLIAGEWGHNPLPWMTPSEFPGELCWCGRRGCIERFLAGPSLAADHARVSGGARSAAEIARAAEAGDGASAATLERYAERLARALAVVINLLDPDAIVLGGGVSNIPLLYRRVPELWGSYVFSDEVGTALLPAEHGDSSGVRGAAWLWP
jgi:fructokinase